MAQTFKRPHLEVADILRLYGEEYLRTHPSTAEQRAVMRHIVSCRTATLGGHKERCDRCGNVRHSYNSCRDRHCPKCQNLKKAEWLEARLKRILPTNYFHVVFTLPAQLRPLARQNRRLFYDLLFRCAAESIQTLTRDPKHLGAEVGFTAILHTWTQQLGYHPHLHCVVTGGGLSEKGDRWVKGSSEYFLPVDVLGALFKGKFLSALKEAYREGRLWLKGRMEKLKQGSLWKRLLDELYDLKWNVDARPPFGGAEQVFRYLGRYTHRVAISNHRLIALKDGCVHFEYRDRADGNKKKTIRLEAKEFIRRFLLHVLPRKYVRIRHFGLLASRSIRSKLERAFDLLKGGGDPRVSCGRDAEETQPRPPWWERLLKLTGVDILACPVCRAGRFRRVARLAPELPAPNRSPPRFAGCST